MKIIADELVQNPMVSVVIPSYNRADTVSQTIESIVNQQCDFEIELIIGDDCSTDNARDVLLAYQAKYPSIIKLLFHDENIGLGANWASCIKQCRGKYISNCDNDDYWHNPLKLQLQVAFMEQNPQYGFSQTDYRRHNRKTGRITEHKLTTYKCENPETIDAYRETIQRLTHEGCNATVMYRKSVLFTYVNFDDYLKYRFRIQEWNTWLLIAPFTEIGCLRVSTATFGMETRSITRPPKNAKAFEERWKGYKECHKYVSEKLPTYYSFNEKEYDDNLNGICLNFAFEILDYRNAKKYALRSKDSFKVRCAKNRLLFYAYAIAGKLKKKFFYKD